MKKLFFVLGVALGVAGCSNNDELAKIVTGNGNAQMSSKPAVYGVVTGNSLLRAVSAATRIEITSSPAYSTFATVRNNLSWTGGKEADAISYRAALEFVVRASVLLVDADALKGLSDPTKVFRTPITGSNFDSMAGSAVRTALARGILLSLTGVEGTEAEVISLKGAMDELIPLFQATANNEAEKKKCLAALAAIVMMGNLWHGG
jgi:hypothetical protein